MTDDLLQRAHWGDLSGMHFAGLVRLSFELETEAGSAEHSAAGYLTGRDVKGRDEQTKDCRSFVEHRKGIYVHTYEEPDTSAYKRKRVVLPDGRIVYRVVRPIFEGALEDLKRGRTPDGQRLDGLVVYDIDRLTRDNRHLEDAIEVVQHFNRPIIDITGTLDLLTDNGRTVARIVVATYNKQSADTARRVKRKHRALEQAGIPTGGNRPFGWLADKRTINPDEAAVIREGYERLIVGAPLAAIVSSWNEQGWQTTQGHSWLRQTVKNVYRNPRICGYRSRQVRAVDPTTGKGHLDIEIVRNDKGEPVIGQWEPILTVEEWEAVTAIIGHNPVAGRGTNSRVYLLTGTLRCGKPECGTVLRATKAHAARTKTPGRFYYSCPGKSAGGCGGTGIRGPETDEAITKLVIRKYELEAVERNTEQTPQIWPKNQELADVRTQLSELTTAWRQKQISGSRYFGLLAELEQEEQDLRADRDQWLARQHGKLYAPGLRKRWPSLTLAEKRVYVQDALIAVTVGPANGQTRWNPGRLVPLWRDV